MQNKIKNILLPGIGWQLCISILFFASCSTIGRSKKDTVILSPGPLKSVEQFNALEPLGEDFVAISEEMWSPGQRKMMASYYFLVAEQLALSGNLKDSGDLYQTAYNLDPNGLVGSKMVAVKAALGDIKGARLEANRLVLLYPIDANINFLFGRLLLADGMTDEAQKYFKKTLTLDKTNEAAYLALIEIYSSQKKMHEAEKVAEEFITHLPWSTNGWIQATRIKLLVGDKKNALEKAEKAYKLDPNQPELILLYAITLELNGETNASVALFEQLFRQNPSSENILSGIIELYRKIGNLEEAVALIDSVGYDIKNESHAMILLHKAILLGELGREDEAFELVQKIGTAHPQNDRLQYILGWAYEQKKLFVDAIKTFHLIPNTSRLKPYALVREALILKTQSKKNEAKNIIDGWLTDNEPVEPELINIFASLLADLDEFERGIELINQAFSKNIKTPELLFLRGVIEEQANMWDAASKTMEEVIADNPDHAEALNFLAYLWANQKINLKEAEQHVTRALKFRPNSGHYLDTLGWIYFQMGNYPEAEKFLLKAEQNETSEGVIFEHLGDLYKVLKQEEKMLEYYKKIGSGNLEKRDRARLKIKLAPYGIKVPDEK